VSLSFPVFCVFFVFSGLMIFGAYPQPIDVPGSSRTIRNLPPVRKTSGYHLRGHVQHLRPSIFHPLRSRRWLPFLSSAPTGPLGAGHTKHPLRACVSDLAADEGGRRPVCLWAGVPLSGLNRFVFSGG